MLSRRTLLLADDSLTVQKVVSLTFADEGMEVLTVSGGEEALAVLGRVVPDVLLADVHMPAPGGYELCARVKRDARTARVPVLLLVGTFEPFDEAEARRVGADGVLTKPFQSIRELVHKVGGLISGHPEQSKDSVATLDDDASAEATEVTAARESPSFAGAEEVQPSPAFAGFDADDESIESVPADDFVAAVRARAEDAAAEFVTADAPFARATAGEPFAREAADVTGEDRGAEAAAVMEASSFGAAAGSRGGSGYGAARFVAPRPDSSFASRASQPVSDDSLRELGEVAPPRSRAAADTDDLILDMGDEEEATAAAPDSAEVFGAVQVEASAETPAEVSAAAEISPANLSSAWSATPRFDAPDAPAAFAEPTPDSPTTTESAEPEYEIEVETAASAYPASESGGVEPVETQDKLAAAPESFEPAEAHDTPVVAAAAMPAEPAQAEAAAPRADAAETADGAAQLSPEMVDAVARRVVELMSDRAVREIAWEVVPDLAERLIRERLEQENARTR